MGASTPLQELTQARYERHLLGEITKLQAALAEERAMLLAHQQQVQGEAQEARERKTSESEKASKLRDMELAIEAAQKDEQKAFNRRRAAKDKEMAQREAEAARERKLEARKKEEQRQLAQKLHEEGLARAADERRQMEDSKRAQDEAKEKKLRERMQAEKEALQDRNLRKAEEAAAKVDRAAQQRVAMTLAQRAAYAERHAAQQERMEANRLKQEAHIAELRAAGEQKRQVIEKTQQQQAALEEARRTAILHREARKQRELDEKAEAEKEARARMQHERMLQEAASRARVEQTMGELQAQLSTLETQLEARSSKVNSFVDERNRQIHEGQSLAVRGSLERTNLSNSMGKMRQNLTNNNGLYLNMPADRRQVANPELKALLDRVDPEGEGHISLGAMRKTLTKLLPPAETGKILAKRVTSSSMPSLSSSLENLHMSRYERVVAAFRELDTDNSGSISKRELYHVLKKAGLSNGKQAVEVFAGADANDDGQLSFEEFNTIAKAIC